MGFYICLFVLQKNLVTKMDFIDSILSLYENKSFRNSLLSSILLATKTCTCHDDCSYFIKNALKLIEHVSA